MDSEAKIYLQRAESKLILARATFDISLNEKTKESLGIPGNMTFYNDVISESYYSIFYAAKAILSSKGIRTKAPEEHRKTYEEFRKIAGTDDFSGKLLEIYEAETVKAETLLNIFFSEKRKRGLFTYNVKSEANIPYAKESLNNAKTFLASISGILKKG
jgi:uncharacterized protein (UPF0332 family)